jgi:hypothetical protein
LMLRLTAVFTAVPASEPAMPSADMPTGRAAPLRSEGGTRASPRADRVRLEARVMSFIRNAYRCLQLSLISEPPFDRVFESGSLIRIRRSLTPRRSPPRRPHSRARVAAYPSARVPRSEVRPEPPTEARRPSRGRLRPGRPAVRANHQRGIRRA